MKQFQLPADFPNNWHWGILCWIAGVVYMWTGLGLENMLPVVVAIPNIILGELFLRRHRRSLDAQRR